MQGVGAAVIGAGIAFDKAGFFHFIQHDHEAAGKHAQKFRQFLLADAGVGADDAEDAGVGGREFQRREPRGETGGRVRTNL